MAKNAILSHAEVMGLIKAAQKGNEDARERLVVSNTRLVWSVVQRFINRGYEPDDLFQIGVIGLLKGIDKFNMEYGVKFSTYAVPMMIGEIQRFIRDDGVIKFSRSVKDLSYKIRRAELVDKTPEEILEALKDEVEDLTIEKVMDAITYIRSHVASMDEVVYEGKDNSDITLGDQLSGDVNGEWADSLELQEALDKLDERSRQIMTLRYYKDRTQSEVAEQLGISQVQVSRLEKKILINLKELMEETTMPTPEQKEKAINLLQATTLTLTQISKETGVSLPTISSWGKKYRDPEVNKENQRKNARRTAQLRKKDEPIETPVINHPAFMGDKDTEKAEIKEEKPVKTIGEAAKEYEAEIRKQLRAEIEEEVRREFSDSLLAADLETVPVVEPMRPVVAFSVDVKFGGQHVTKDQAVESLYEAYNLVKRLPTNSLSLNIVVNS